VWTQEGRGGGLKCENVSNMVRKSKDIEKNGLERKEYFRRLE